MGFLGKSGGGAAGADDGNSGITEHAFTITVANVNDAPEFVSSPPSSTDEDAAFIYSISTADVDAGDTLTLAAPTLPGWLTLADNDETALPHGGLAQQDLKAKGAFHRVTKLRKELQAATGMARHGTG